MNTYTAMRIKKSATTQNISQKHVEWKKLDKKYIVKFHIFYKVQKYTTLIYDLKSRLVVNLEERLSRKKPEGTSKNASNVLSFDWLVIGL